MDKFTNALQVLLAQEGGYVYDKNDPGGETNFGISKKMYPSLDIQALTSDEAGEIYKKDYWQEAFEEIGSQEIINKTFSIGVNIGMAHSIMCLQRAVRAACGTQLDEDGYLGPISISYINLCSPITLLAALKSEIAGFYRRINNPHELAGWLNRSYA